MARTGTIDPLTNFRYVVHIQVDNDPNFFQRLGFESVTSPRVDIQKSQYKEMGRHLSPRNLVDSATFSPVTFRRGKNYGADFYNWIGMVYRAFYGDGQGNTTNYRANIVIDHYNRSGKIVKKYVLINAAPITYIPASNLDAMDDQSISIETLMVDYEGYMELSLDYSAITAIGGEVASRIFNGAGYKLMPGFTQEINQKLQSINAVKIPNA